MWVGFASIHNQSAYHAFFCLSHLLLPALAYRRQFVAQGLKFVLFEKKAEESFTFGFDSKIKSPAIADGVQLPIRLH
ncbi:MAG: hypothetical protein ACK41E_11805 [Deinococcales bacterium]